MDISDEPVRCSLIKVETKVAKKTLSPVWEETFHILVQEPETQMLKVEVFDHDTISLKVAGLQFGFLAL